MSILLNFPFSFIIQNMVDLNKLRVCWDEVKTLLLACLMISIVVSDINMFQYCYLYFSIIEMKNNSEQEIKQNKISRLLQ